MARIGESCGKPALTLLIALLAVVPTAGRVLGETTGDGLPLASSSLVLSPQKTAQAEVAATVAQSAPNSQTAPDSQSNTPDSQSNTVRVSGASMANLTQALEQAFTAQFPQTKLTLTTDSTEAALKKLLAGEIDLAAIGRPLTEAEQQAGLVTTPIARNKIAVVVGKDNAFNGSLTDVQVARIFRGEITNWAAVGGRNSAIRVVDRPAQDDIREAFRSYPVFQTAPFAAATTATTLSDTTPDALVKALGKNGIGFAVADQVLQNPNLKILRMHKTLPTDARYPFSQPLLYVYRSNPSSQVKAFLEFAQKPANQSLIEQARITDAVSPVASDTSSATSSAASDSTSPTSASKASSSNPTSSAPDTSSETSAATQPDGSGNSARPVVAPGWLWLTVPLLAALLWWLLKRGQINQLRRSESLPNPPSNSLPPNSVASTADAPPESIPGSIDRFGQSTANTVDSANVVPVGAGAATVLANRLEQPAATQSVATPSNAESTVAQGGGQLAEPFLDEAADVRSNSAGLASDDAGQDRDSRVVLVPRSAEQAYVYWELSPDQRAVLQQGDGQRLMMRIHDVTHLDIDYDPPHHTQEYVCDQAQQDMEVLLPAGQRDYLAELGYRTSDQRWQRLVRSAPTHLAEGQLT